LVFYSSVITMMHGPINIRLTENKFVLEKVAMGQIFLQVF